MSRDFLHAYLKAQQSHKVIHRLTKAFETNATDDEIRRLAREARAAIADVQQLIDNITGE